MAGIESTDDLLRELHELIEYADNSCSEPDDFIRGMRFMFEALAQKVAPAEPAAVNGIGSAPPTQRATVTPPRLTP